MVRALIRWSNAGHGSRRVKEAVGDGGFTLLESVVAFGLFMILAASAGSWLVKTIQLTGLNSNRVTASQLATQELEKVRGESNAGQSLDSGPDSVVVHGATYTVTTSLTPGSTDACAIGSSRQVSVTVTWSGAPAAVQYDSVLAC